MLDNPLLNVFPLEKGKLHLCMFIVYTGGLSPQFFICNELQIRLLSFFFFFNQNKETLENSMFCNTHP